ncbi:hypothetical protein IJ095_03025 [Candidatus Saccharibacteria bacterium]|nr:hypothetical protein [Candidatus Saccharibacteria bacterium]
MQDQHKINLIRARSQGDYIGHYCNPLASSGTLTSAGSSQRAARRSFYCSLARLAVFLLSFVLIPYAVAESSAHAETVSAGAMWDAVSLELDPDVAATEAGGSISDSNHGDILFGDIHPTSVSDGNLGTEVVIKKTIGITTPGKFYAVYLSTISDSNALSHTFSSTNATIPAITNSIDSQTGLATPAIFSDSSWGWTLSSIIPSNKLGQELTKVNDAAIYNQDTWSAVPIFGQAVELYTNTTASNAGFSAGDTFDIYYGIMIDTDVLAGTYTNELVYTALASSDSLDTASKNLTRSTYYVSQGTNQTLSFDLSASVSSSSASSLITADNITVYLVPHSTILASKDSDGNYTVTSSMRTTATLSTDDGGYQTCTFTDENLSLTDNGAIIVCTMPAETILGDNDDEGYYDFWLHIEPYDYNYISRYTSPSSLETNQTAASVLYAGLQSRTSDNDNDGEYDYIISEMQEITPAICANTNRWNNIAGSGARILDYSGTTQLVNDITMIDPETGEDVLDETATLAANAATGVGTFALTDVRDGTEYLVRHLADGNCWMAQNLRLDLSTVGTLTPADTNIATDYTPNAETIFTFPGASSDTSAHIKNYGLTYIENGTIYVDSDYTPAHALTYTGIYYNWYAATAETIKGDYLASYDICPRGWQLPVRGTTSGKANKSVVGLILNPPYYDPSGTALTTNSIDDFLKLTPFNFANTGFISYSSSNRTTTSASYTWTKNSYNAGSARDTKISASIIDDQSNKRTAMPIRCVAQ